MKRLWLAVIASLLAVGGAAAQVPTKDSWKQMLADAAIVDNKIPIAASAIGTTGVISATLTADPLKINFICGFVITSFAPTATEGHGTVIGVQGGTLDYDFLYPATGKDLIGVVFPECLSATGKNVAIVVTKPAGATTISAAVTVWGYKQ